VALEARVRSAEDVEKTLRFRLGEGLESFEENHGQLVARVAPARRADVLRALREELGFRFYTFCCGVDWPEQDTIEVFDHAYAVESRQRITVKYTLPRDNPRVPTGVHVYAGADWHERETWELFGVVFEGHPRLRRLLLPEWEEGYPMRKDHELRARVEKPWPGDFFSG
jgi:NADH-quinone oxidoreductase subunit C